MEVNTEKIARLVRELLIEIGEDPAREGLLRHAAAGGQGVRVPHIGLSHRSASR